MKSFSETFEALWRQHPALFYALSVLFGCFFAFNGSLSTLLPALIIILPILFKPSFALFIRTVLAFSLMIGAFFYTSYSFHFPSLPPNGVSGMAFIEISSLSTKTTHFGKRWAYQGIIKNFIPDSSSHQNDHFRNLPFSLGLPYNEEIHHPLANQAYRIHGHLKQTNQNHYLLSVKKDEPWFPIQGSWGLAEWRYSLKQKVKVYISQFIKDEHASIFLTGVATGEFDDRFMSFEFARFGLSHIMAISGFHFAIICSILNLKLRFIFSKKISAIILIFLLTAYFIFLGNSPSVMRAWITICIALASYLFQKQGSALNSLGIAMLAILLYNPLMCMNLGFQFSFLTTASILIFFKGFDQLLQKAFKKRSLSKAIEMNAVNQHAYCFLAIFRQSLALGLAVNLIALPTTLFIFQKFPVLGLVYNLFFPFMVSISMLLLIMGMLLHSLLPPIGEWIHSINSVYSSFILKFTHNIPTPVDLMVKVNEFPLEIFVFYLSVCFCSGIYIKNKMEEKSHLDDWALI